MPEKPPEERPVSRFQAWANLPAESKAAAAMGAAALAAIVLMPLLFREPGGRAAVTAAGSDPDAPAVFHPRAKKAGGVAAAAEASASSGSGAAGTSASADAAWLADLRAGKRAAGGARAGGGAAAGKHAAPPADPRKAAAALGLPSVPAKAADPSADSLRDWNRLSLTPFSHQPLVSDAGEAATTGGTAGSLAGAPETGSAFGAGSGPSAGSSASADARAAARKAARGAAGGIDLNAAQAALDSGRDALKKNAACLEASRTHESEIQKLTGEYEWTAGERARSQCPAKPCGWIANVCGRADDENHPMFWWYRWACYCDGLVCRSQKLCGQINQSNCDQARACGGSGASCAPAQCD